MSDDETMYQQLDFIMQRLQTFPHANHEAQMLNDCMVLLIRTIAGEEISPGHEVIAGGQMLDDGQTVAVDQTYQNRGGVEIAPGVVQHTGPNRPGGIQQQMQPHSKSGSLVNVEAGMAAFNGRAPSGEPACAELQVKPVPGSLMDAAMQQQAQGDTSSPAPDVVADMEELLGEGIPAPSDTQLEIHTKGG